MSTNELQSQKLFRNIYLRISTNSFKLLRMSTNLLMFYLRICTENHPHKLNSSQFGFICMICSSKVEFNWFIKLSWTQWVRNWNEYFLAFNSHYAMEGIDVRLKITRKLSSWCIKFQFIMKCASVQVEMFRCFQKASRTISHRLLSLPWHVPVNF